LKYQMLGDESHEITKEVSALTLDPKWSYCMRIPSRSLLTGRSRWSWCGPSEGTCLDGLVAWLRTFCFTQRPDSEEERVYFEKTVAFLRSVPLFKRQLPSCELPKLARDLKRKMWRPGEKIVNQGEVGRAFYLIESGVASVIVADCDGQEKVRATLIAGDYFGGHTLVAERSNVGTVVAQGPEQLVTLSMSRRVFEESGLKDKLCFPKRPALYFDRPGRGRDPSIPSFDLANCVVEPHEQAFVLEALKQNVNLRALHNVDNEVMQSIARGAVRRFVPKGTVVAQSGALGKEFFIIKTGRFHAVAETDAYDGQKSAEATVAQLTMSERLKRKQTFLKSLCRHKGSNTFSHSQSVRLPAPKGPKAMADWADDLSMACNSTPVHLRGCPSAASTMTLPSPCSDAGRTPLSTVASQRDFGVQSFQVGDKVTMSDRDEGSSGQVGTVSECGRDGVGRPWVKVTFQGALGEWLVEPDTLRSASEADVVAELEPRDSFGELSLIYNTFREATFKAVEDSEVYVISRKHFKAHFNRRGPRFKDYCALLDEVPALWPLLRAERWELACNALGLFTFRPGERIIHQGLQRKSALWYIVFSGSCVVSASHTGPDGQETTEVISTLRRPGHFGERSLLRGGEHAIPEVSVDAGKEGLVCLAFEGQAIRVLLEELSIQGAFGDGAEALLPNVNSLSSIEYELAKLGRMRRQRVQTEEIDMMSLNKVCHLGRGGFADVYLMEDSVSQKRYAMKCISKGHVEKFEAVRQVCWEREMLMTVDSPFVIRLVRTHKDAEFLYILLEAALGGTLYKLMRQKPEVFCDDEPRGSSSAFFVACIIAALEHLHDRRIVYRDLKPENVLLDEHGYAKLCDMGFARFVISKTNTLAGTPEYMAPEVIDFPHAHDVTCDWWSLGVLTFELNAGQPPWEDEGVADLFGKLLAIRRSQEKGEPRYPFSCPLLVRNFISKLLTKLPHRLGARQGARELREHFFFKKLSFDFQALKAQTLPPPIARPFQQRENAVCGMEDLSGELLKSSELFQPVQGACMWDADF